MIFMIESKLIRYGSTSLILLLALSAPCTQAQVATEQAAPAQADQIVKYDSAFFSRYQPNTAFDMVKQVPGFQLDDGDTSRGFATTAGNVLINGRRPSAKQDRPSATLSRIPASQVAGIELIRGQMQGLDMLGQQAVVNVLLRDDAPAAIRWESFLLYSSSGPIKPGLRTSLSDRWKDIEYNVGFGLERNSNGEFGDEIVLDGNGKLIESRFDDEDETGLQLSGVFINTASWIGQSFVHVNGKFGLSNAPEIRYSNRTPLLPKQPFNIIFRDGQHREIYELGMDGEHVLTNELMGKAILLYTRTEYDVLTTQSTRALSGLQTAFRQVHTASVNSESIGRFEFDWSGMTNHAWQLNMETAYNVLDGTLEQIVDRGAGPVPVDVPGANSRVEEIRGDFLLKDTWSLGKFELDYGLGAETSTISQTGDAELKRNFFFVKPAVVLSYSPSQGNQTRVRLAREVAQLDFEDFISATVYEDDDLALGNPNLKPDTTWIAEIGQEKRFGKQSVIKVTLFHHWIKDVLDLLPLSATFEAPGNIGDGKRYGIEIENTLPLEWLGLLGARLDVKLRWQNSSVVDPVTGRDRTLTAVSGFSGPPIIRFSNDNRYVYNVAYRQDFESARVAWGWQMAAQADRPIYKVNELEINDEGVLVNTFIETTRWFGVKIRVEGNNLLDYDELRDRTLYTGARDLSPVDSRIIRNRSAGWRLNFDVSGSF